MFSLHTMEDVLIGAPHAENTDKLEPSDTTR